MSWLRVIKAGTRSKPVATATNASIRINERLGRDRDPQFTDVTATISQLPEPASYRSPAGGHL